jgi:hypothetical protein
MEELIYKFLAICFGVLTVTAVYTLFNNGDSHESLIQRRPPCEYGTHPERSGYTFNRRDHVWEPVYDCRPDNRTVG